MDKNNKTPTQVPRTNLQDELNALKAKIEERKAARDRAREESEDKFFAQEEELLPPEIVELKYSSDPADKKRYQKALQAAKAEFEKKELEPYDLDISALEDAYEKKVSEIDEAEKQRAIEEGRAAFLAENPDVDFAKLAEFWAMDMTPRQKQAINDAVPPGDIKGYYTAVLSLMRKTMEQNKEEPTQKEKLPPQFDGNSIPAKTPIRGGDNEAYLAAIGVR